VVELQCPVGTRIGTGASGHGLRWKFAGRGALLSLVGYSKMRLSHGPLYQDLVVRDAMVFPHQRVPLNGILSYAIFSWPYTLLVDDVLGCLQTLWNAA